MAVRLAALNAYSGVVFFLVYDALRAGVIEVALWQQPQNPVTWPRSDCNKRFFMAKGYMFYSSIQRKSKNAKYSFLFLESSLSDITLVEKDTTATVPTE